MITRSQYEELIRDNLKGITWSRLKNALLGKELISFGGVVNELISGQYDLFLRDLAPELASYTGLAVIGYNQQVGYNTIKPTKAIVDNQVSEGVPPFKAILSIGNNRYYNTSFIGAGQSQLILSQGSLGCASFGDEIPDFGTYYQSGIYWQNRKKYIKLPEATDVESLYVYITKDGVRTPAKIWDSEDVRVFRQADNALAVMLLNTSEYDQISQVECYFLVGTTEVSSSGTTIKGELQLPGRKVQVTVTEIEGDSSIAAARESLVHNLSLRSSVSTKAQIKEFVNSYPQVRDCNPELTAANTITVWVDPTVDNPSFDDIQAGLTLYGEMAIYWQVKKGTAIPVTIRLTPIGQITGDERAEVLTEVTTWVEENIKFDTVLTPAWVLQSVLAYANRIITSLVLDEQVNSRLIKLVAVPVAGTISFIKDGTEVGWDSRGYIRGYLSQGRIDTLANLVRAGSVFLIPGSTSVKVISEQNSMSEVSSALWDLTGVTLLMVGDGYVLAYWNRIGLKQYKLYQIDTRFALEKNSLIKDSEQFVSSTYPPVDGFLTSDESILDEGQSLLIGTTLYNLRQSGTSLYLRKFGLSADGSKFVLNYNLGTAVIENVRTSDFALFTIGGVPVIAISTLQGSTYTDQVYVLDRTDESTEESLVQVEIDEQQESGLFNGIKQAKSEGSKVTLVTDARGGIKIKTTTLSINKVAEGAFFLRNESAVVESSFDRQVTLVTSEFYIDSRGEQLRKVSDGATVFKVGDTIPALINVGLVDYNNGQISLSSDGFDNTTVQYQTSELSLTDKSMYPKIKEITWYETDK